MAMVRCPNCPAKINNQLATCPECGNPTGWAPVRAGAPGPTPKAVIVKSYNGNQADAASEFQRDAAKLAAQRYFPASQSFTPGAYGCGSFLLALLLCAVVIGILIFIYMMIVKPPGVLTVTYEYRGVAGPVVVEDVKTCPKCAETIKAAALVCRFCQHQFDPREIQRAELVKRVAAEEEAERREQARRAALQKTVSYQLGKWVGEQRAKKPPKP